MYSKKLNLTITNEVDAIIILISQTKKVKYREVK